MLMFKYVARNTKTGERVRAKVEAENELTASKVIRQQGLMPLDIRLEGTGPLADVVKRFNRIGAKQRVLFSRQMSTLINAGLR